MTQTYHTLRTFFLISWLGLLLIFVGSCSSDFLNTEPTDKATPDQLRKVPSANKTLLSGIYASMYAEPAGESAFGQKAIDLATDVMLEDIALGGLYGFGDDYIFQNRLSTFGRPSNTWLFYYKLIFMANQVRGNLSEDTAALKKDADARTIAGQVLFLRAYAYYYLVNLFQQPYEWNKDKPGVPIYLTVSIEGKPRAKVSEVYDQILADLLVADELLAGYKRPDKTSVDQNVVRAQLARVYLMMKDYPNAAKYARLARVDYPLMDASTYQSGSAFSSIDNPEWMWGSDINLQTRTVFASFFSHIDNTIDGYAVLGYSPKLINSVLWNKIPSTDIRKMVIADIITQTFNGYVETGPYAILKFKSPLDFTGDYCYFRASEMYFIEAEAEARNSNESNARDLLYELVHERDPSYTKSTKTGQDLYDEIFFQKRIELFGEGVLFYDYKRLGKGIDRTGDNNHLDDARAKIKVDNIAIDNRFIFQLPSIELETNPLISSADQNP